MRGPRENSEQLAYQMHSHSLTHSLTHSAGEKMLVGDGLGPGYSQDSLTVLRVQSGQFV